MSNVNITIASMKHNGGTKQYEVWHIEIGGSAYLLTRWGPMSGLRDHQIRRTLRGDLGAFDDVIRTKKKRGYEVTSRNDTTYRFPDFVTFCPDLVEIMEADPIVDQNVREAMIGLPVPSTPLPTPCVAAERSSITNSNPNLGMF